MKISLDFDSHNELDIRQVAAIGRALEALIAPDVRQQVDETPKGAEDYAHINQQINAAFQRQFGSDVIPQAVGEYDADIVDEAPSEDDSTGAHDFVQSKADEAEAVPQPKRRGRKPRVANLPHDAIKEAEKAAMMAVIAGRPLPGETRPVNEPEVVLISQTAFPDLVVFQPLPEEGKSAFAAPQTKKAPDINEPQVVLTSETPVSSLTAFDPATVSLLPGAFASASLATMANTFSTASLPPDDVSPKLMPTVLAPADVPSKPEPEIAPHPVALPASPVTSLAPVVPPAAPTLAPAAPKIGKPVIPMDGSEMSHDDFLSAIRYATSVNQGAAFGVIAKHGIFDPKDVAPEKRAAYAAEICYAAGAL